MPKYLYRCEDCGVDWYVTLSLSEAQETKWINCLYCVSSSCNRVPQTFSVREEKKETPKQVGDITESFIEEAREELDQQKKEASSKEYKV